jgi:hypothetical protein
MIEECRVGTPARRRGQNLFFLNQACFFQNNRDEEQIKLAFFKSIDERSDSNLLFLNQ